MHTYAEKHAGFAGLAGIQACIHTYAYVYREARGVGGVGGVRGVRGVGGVGGVGGSVYIYICLSHEL